MSFFLLISSSVGTPVTSVGQFFVFENGVGYQLRPNGAQGTLARTKLTHLETFRGSVFVIFQIVSRKKGSWNPSTLQYSRFLMGFCVAVGVPGRWFTCNPYAPAQSKRIFMFSFSFSENSFQKSLIWVHFGDQFHRKSQFCKRTGMRNTERNKVPAYSN